MKQCFKHRRLQHVSMQLVAHANQIIESYKAQGYRMTLRQLYYQFVSRNLLLNTERNYKRLGSIINDARYAGLIDWDAIEDRNRLPQRHPQFGNLANLADAALASYRLDRWAGQEYHVELWVEKAALAGVLLPLANEWHATLMVNRGYSSASAMYESSLRFRATRGAGIVLYLGDHDPSGEDMVRDIQERLDCFKAGVTVVKVALTMDQIEEHNPPPNPAKVTDSRYEKYAEKHGTESWEVDALPPNVLSDLIRKAFRKYVDKAQLDIVLARERRDKRKFADALDKATQGESKVNRAMLRVDHPPFE